MKRISVIIPTYKRNELLDQCLRQLSPLKQSLQQDNYEVIVSDDSPDFEAKILVEEKYPWASWFEGPKKGPAANRNNGAKYAVGEWYIFIDDDCIPDVDLLQSYFKGIKENRFGAMEGRIESDRARQRFDEESPLNLYGDCFWSCNMAVKKSIFEKLKGFDENFPYPAMEDVDFYLRLKEVTKTGFVSNAKVIHPWRRIQPNRIYKQRFYSHLYLLKKNKIEKSLIFRLQRLNLFLITLKKNFFLLAKFSFKGKRVFLEKQWYNFRIIFS